MLYSHKNIKALLKCILLISKGYKAFPPMLYFSLWDKMDCRGKVINVDRFHFRAP